MTRPANVNGHLVRACVLHYFTVCTIEQISPRAGLELRTARSLGQRLTELPELPLCLDMHKCHLPFTPSEAITSQ